MKRQARLVIIWSLISILNLALADNEIEHDEDERAGAFGASHVWQKNPNLMNVQPGIPILPPISTYRPLPTTLPQYIPPVGGTTRCYACSDCPKVMSNTPNRYIPQTFDPNRRDKCVVYTEKYNNVANALVFRGSAVERGTCEEIRKSHLQHNFVSLVSCDECVGDLCNTNSAGRSIPDLTMAVIFIVIAPLLAKRVLS